MSDVEVLSPTSPHRPEEAEMEPEEQELEAAENETNQAEAQGEGEQQEIEEEHEEEKRPAEEDRTEDQVPDITGTENADVMATSLDGIEEIPASEETQMAAESTEFLDASPQVVTEEAVGDTAEEENLQETEAQHAPETHEEKAPEAEKEEKVAEVESEIEGEQEVAEEIAHETETTEEPGEIVHEIETEILEETTKPEEHAELETYAEEHKAEDVEHAAPQENGFELQAPPTPKRPRTPNELDNAILAEEHVTEEVTKDEAPVETHESEQEVVTEVAEEHKTEEVVPESPLQSVEEAAKEPETPSTRKSSVPEPETPSTRKSSVPATPKTSVSSTPSTPKSATVRAKEEMPSTPRNVAASPRTPLAKEETKTPMTDTPQSKKAFDFEQPPVETPKTPKSITFDESVTTTPKTPKSARTPKTPRTPKSPKTPKSEVEAPSEPPSEPVPEPEPVQEEAYHEVEQAEEEAEPVSEPVEVVEATPETTEEVIERKVSGVEEPVENGVEQKEIETEVADEVKEPTPPAAEEVEEEKFTRVEAPIVGAEDELEKHGRIEDREEEHEAPAARRPRPERSPSPVRHKPAAVPRETSFTHYDEDSFRSKGAPPRIPSSNASFSSYTPVEKPAYSSISPWVQSANKYRTDYSKVSTYRSPSLYLSQFDDMVSTGAFSNSLYSTNRLLERSRSRARERKHAMRSARSASNYYRYTSTYATVPIRTREYSTPPTSALTRHPSRSSSFISFIEYSGAKQYELARSRSRSYGFETPYSRSGSHSNIEPFYETGRLSRVDSFVRDLDGQYESRVPSTYAKYRSSSRSNIPHAYVPLDGYMIHNSPSYVSKEAPWYDKQSVYDTGASVRGMYEARIGDLERSLSRERFARDRMNVKYTELSKKLEQACRQMELLRANSYSSIRATTGRYSVYSHFYPNY